MGTGHRLVPCVHDSLLLGVSFAGPGPAGVGEPLYRCDPGYVELPVHHRAEQGRGAALWGQLPWPRGGDPGNLVLYLYNMDNGVFADRKKQREKEQGKPQADPASFSDVAEDNPYYDAVYWAYGSGLVGGTTDTEFSPDHSLTREQVHHSDPVCRPGGDLLIQAVEPEAVQKTPWRFPTMPAQGSPPARWQGVVKGYEDNFFYPQNTMTKRGVCRSGLPGHGGRRYDSPGGAAWWTSPRELTTASTTNIRTSPSPPWCLPEEEGHLVLFDQAVVHRRLHLHDLGVLLRCQVEPGRGQVPVSYSMSPTNMLTGKILPEYPKGSGQKPAIEDSVAATGAKVVYIMLGMDNIAYGIEAGHQRLPDHHQQHCKQKP